MCLIHKILQQAIFKNAYILTCIIYWYIIVTYTHLCNNNLRGSWGIGTVKGEKKGMEII